MNHQILWSKDNYLNIHGVLKAGSEKIEKLNPYSSLCDNVINIYHYIHINDFNLKALCESLEDTVYRLRKELVEKNSEIDLLNDELALYKRQVEMLTTALRYSTIVMPPESLSLNLPVAV